MADRHMMASGSDDFPGMVHGLVAEHRFFAAKKILMDSLSKKGGNPVLLRELASVENKIGDNTNAASHLKEALKLDSSNALIVRDYAETLRLSGHYHEALSVILGVDDELRSDPAIRVFLGNLYRRITWHAHAFDAYGHLRDLPMRALLPRSSSWLHSGGPFRSASWALECEVEETWAKKSGDRSATLDTLGFPRSQDRVRVSAHLDIVLVRLLTWQQRLEAFQRHARGRFLRSSILALAVTGSMIYFSPRLSSFLSPLLPPISRDWPYPSVYVPPYVPPHPLLLHWSDWPYFAPHPAHFSSVVVYGLAVVVFGLAISYAMDAAAKRIRDQSKVSLFAAECSTMMVYFGLITFGIFGWDLRGLAGLLAIVTGTVFAVSFYPRYHRAWHIWLLARRNPREVVLGNFLDVLKKLRNLDRRDDLSGHAELMATLANNAWIIERFIPAGLEVHDRVIRGHVMEWASNAAEAVRMTASCIATSTEHERDQLIVDLRNNAIAIASGYFGDLQIEQSTHSPHRQRVQRLLPAALALVLLGTAIVIPLVILNMPNAVEASIVILLPALLSLLTGRAYGK